MVGARRYSRLKESTGMLGVLPFQVGCDYPAQQGAGGSRNGFPYGSKELLRPSRHAGSRRYPGELDSDACDLGLFHPLIIGLWVSFPAASFEVLETEGAAFLGFLVCSESPGPQVNLAD